MRHLTEFDDAGAPDDEPSKGVTVGDIRAWLDENDRLRAALLEISRVAGRFSMDPLEHASNTIEDMQDVAIKALKEPAE